jgi:isochorismate synthase
MKPPRLAPRAVPVDDPGDLLAIASSTHRRPIFYLENPSREFAVLGLGAAAEIRSSGPSRFRDAAVAARQLFTALPPGDPPPLLLGGFAFSGESPRSVPWREFPALHFVLPEVTWLRRGGTVYRFETSRGEAPLDARAGILQGAAELSRWRREDDPQEKPRWREAVDGARRAIARGEFRKVVVARRRSLSNDAQPEPARIVARARAARPGCTSFWIAPGGTSFVGSSPEFLLRLHGRRLETEALAGSAPRGATNEEDERLAAALLASEKNRHEHELVVQSIREALAPVSRSLVAADAPAVLRLPEAQHLQTAVRAELDGTVELLEVAERLHPTAAVCGSPRLPSRAWIDRTEGDRGWYSGAVGWLDAAGAGELVVALRCGLIERSRLSLWAGAGIVAGSDADDEFAETEAKLGALTGGMSFE